MAAFPSLFVSHGAPNLLLQDVPAHEFLSGYGETLGRPRAIVTVSAHFEAERPTVGGGSYPPTIHDFGGFEPELYQVYYRASGDPELARDVANLLKVGTFDAQVDRARGLDHGTWVPLVLLYPDATIPVVPLSICPDEGPSFHYEMGRSLMPLRDDDVLIMGSGSLTHNLEEFFKGYFRLTSKPPEWVRPFADWMNDRVEAGAVDDLLNYRSIAPFAEQNHPTEEHLLPFFVALGAADGAKGERVHTSHTYGVLAMDDFRFG